MNRVLPPPGPPEGPEGRRSSAGSQRRASWIRRSRARGSWSEATLGSLLDEGSSRLVVPAVHSCRSSPGVQASGGDHGDAMGRMSPIQYVIQARGLTPDGYDSPDGRLSPEESGGSRLLLGGPAAAGTSASSAGTPCDVGCGAGGGAGGECRCKGRWDRVLQDAQCQAEAVTDPAAQDLYPNCHVHIWLRSCRTEVHQPLSATVTGHIPRWIKGTLLQNGPGSLECGEDRFQHLFDGAALLQRFCISEGQVTYQCRFLRSQTWRRNSAARRIVVTEFGTRAAPDPCQTIFKRVAALFRPGEGMSDNAMISVYPIGDEFYAFTESPVMTRVDPITLRTLGRVNVAGSLGIVNHTSHPLVGEDGSVVNLGMSLSATGPQYSLIHFPAAAQQGAVRAAESGRLHGSVPARWPLHPGYMHSFGATARHWVLVEQPLSVSVPAMVRGQLSGEPLAGSLRWYPDHPTLIHLVSRRTGKRTHTFEADAFFFLHVINCFERPSLADQEAGEVVVDICCYKDPAMISCMYIDALKSAQQNPDYARLFRGRPLRFVLPLQGGCGARLQPRPLCSLGCETPRLNPRYVARPYRYFYAISSDVDAENPGTLIKVDTWSCTCQTWGERGVYPSEPIFVASPDAEREDDGVVLCALVWARDERRAGLLVVDATSMEELGRAELTTPSAVPKCLHGWFTPQQPP